MSLAKDSRVEKIRKHLRDRTDITKSDFLDFVQVYPYFHEAGWVVRPELLEWIEKHVEAVRSWLPEIWSLRSDYFGDVRPESRYTKFEQYDKLVALGLTGPQSGFRGSPELGSSHAVDMAPIQSRSKALFDFGTPIPEPVIQKRPALLGSCQQKVWLDDINGIHKRLESIKRWMIESAKDLSPDDELKEILPNIAAKIPNIQDRVETAQVCFDQVKVDYDAARSKRKRMRDAMFSRPMYSPTPEVAEQVAATLLDEDMPSTSIRVESDIPPNSDQLISATRISTGQPHLSHSDKPPPSTNVHTTTATATDNSHPARPMIARRSAMSNKSVSPKTARKRAASPPDSDNISTYSNRGSGSDSEFPSVRNIPSSSYNHGGKEVSVYDVDSIDDGPPARKKRPRTELGVARRPPQPAAAGSQDRAGMNAPEAVMG